MSVAPAVTGFAFAATPHARCRRDAAAHFAIYEGERMTKLLITTVAALVIGVAISATAQARVAGPTSTVQKAAQLIDLTDKVRRICRNVFKCDRFPCRIVQQCYITADYPPENGRRR
jgi:hypothetical protein